MGIKLPEHMFWSDERYTIESINFAYRCIDSMKERLCDQSAITVKIPPHIVPVTAKEISRYWGKMCLARMKMMYLRRKKDEN